MTDQEEKILYISTCGFENAERAHLPFVLANAALAMDIKATIVLQGSAVYIAQKGAVAHMPSGGGFRPLKELLESFLESGGKLKVCGPCIKERNIDETDLLPGVTVTAAGALNVEAMEANAVFCY